MMDCKLIQTQHSNFDDALTVHPLSLLQQKLHDDIDDETLDKLIFRSKKHLTEHAEITARDEGSFHKWIVMLEGKLGQRDSVEFITNILDSERVCPHLLDSEGAKSWADLMRQYCQEYDEYNARCMERRLCKDNNFTGRDTLIQQIIGIITAPSDHIKGVVLCGEGGMGKTSVGDEVCHRLGNSQHPWKILICNQREKSDLRELLVDLISAFDPETVVGPGIGIEDLKMELAHLITTSKDERQLVLIDNLDEHCDTEPKRQAVCGLLMDILTHIEHTQTLRILVTVCNRLTFDPKIPGSRMEVVELGPLTIEETAAMLRKVTQLSDQDLPPSRCCHMRDLCGGHPMAIRTVAAMLQSACRVDEIIMALQTDSDISSLTNQQLERCIDKSLQLLGNDLSTKHLVKLLAAVSLFQSAHFDLSAAMAVGTVKEGHEAKIREKMERNLRVLNSHLLIEIDKMALSKQTETHNHKSEPESHHMYSLHPQVLRFIKTIIGQSIELLDHYCKAKECFLKYIYKKVSDWGKLLDTEPVRAKQKIDQNVIHIREFYRLLTADKDTDIYIGALDVTSDKQKGRHDDTILKHKQIWKVAEFVLASKSIQPQLFARKQAEMAKKLKQLYEYMHWTCLESEYLVLNDRLELAEQRIDALEEELAIKTPELEGEGTDDWLSASGWIENRNQRIPVVATLHVVKGSICKKRNKMDEALEHFRTARILYEGKQNIPNLIEAKVDNKRIYNKNSYISEFSQAENLMGEVYFEMNQFKRAKDCYQKALDIITNKQETCHRGAASIRANIGACFYADAQSKEGEARKDCLEKACEILCKSLQYHQHTKKGEADTLTQIADVYHLLGRPEEALTCSKQALDIFERGVIPPNIDLTVTMSKVAFYHFHVVKSIGLASEDATKSNVVHQYDKVMNRVLDGGLPLHHRDGETYRHIKAHHMEAMALLDYPERLVQQRMSQYEEFESGGRSKQIQRMQLPDRDFDLKEHQNKAMAEGIELVALPDSDDDSDTEEATVGEVGVSSSSNTEGVPNSKPNDELVLSVSIPRRDSSMDIGEHLSMHGNAMDVDGNSANVDAEMETGLKFSGKECAINDMQYGKDAVRKDVDVKFGTSESLKRPIPSKPLRIQRQASLDLPVIPDTKNCSDVVDAMENRTSSGAVAENKDALKDISEMEESVKLRYRGRKSGTTSTIIRDRKVSFGSVTALGVSEDFRSSITAGDRSLSSESNTSQRDSVFSPGSHDDSLGTTYRLSVSSYDSGHGSSFGSSGTVDRLSVSSFDSGHGSTCSFRSSSSDEWASRKNSISSIGMCRRESWTSGASSGSSEGSRSSMTSRESQDSLLQDGSRATKRKSLSRADSQDGLTAQMRQLVFLTPKAFKDAKNQSSAAKKSRQERL